jgi:hypothetical protein
VAGGEVVSRYIYEFLVEVAVEADDEETADAAFDDTVGEMRFRGGVFHGGRHGNVECVIVDSGLREVEG